MKRPSRIQKVPTRASADIKRTAKRPAPQKADPVGKTHAKSRPAAARARQTFRPMVAGEAKLYSCGPTVYHYAHLGNLRAAVFSDTLRRILQYNGLRVTQVMNITDVGHLVSDEDAGEDKLEKGARRQGRTVWEVARFYEDAFKRDMADLNNLPPAVMPRATDHIPEQIAFQDLNAQEQAISSRLGNVSQFQSPSFVESFVQKYLIANAAGASSSSSAPDLTTLSIQAQGILV